MMNMDGVLKTDQWLSLNPIPIRIDGFPSSTFGTDFTLIEHHHDFDELVTYLSRIYSGITSYQGQNILAIEEIIRFLDQHYMEAIAITELAAKANMSRSSFMRNFKLATDLTPINYLNNIRVEKAARMLLGNKKSITEIGFATGFNSTSYFTTTFRKIMGKTPLEFRKSF